MTLSKLFFLNVIIGAAQEVQKKRAEVEQEIKKQPLNVDTLSKEGFSKVRTRNQNWGFCNKFFCSLLFVGTFTSFFKDKKSKRSRKTVGIKGFLFLLDDRRIRIRTSD
jgi:hypothetical protein